MIDEDLYQQAADELNSDRRRPHIWARACALASDDQDEARYLYTNLRVEELLAERTQQTTISERSSIESDNIDATQVLEPGSETITGDFSDTVGEFSAFLDEENIPQVPDSLTSPENAGAASSYDDASGILDAEILDASLTQSTRDDRDVVSDSSPLDDTYAGLEDPTEVFQKELEKLKAEQGDVNIFESTAAFSRHLDGHIDDEKNQSSFSRGDMPADVDSDSDFHLDPAEIDRLASLDTSTPPLGTQPEVEEPEQHTQPETDLQLEPSDTDAATPFFSSSEKKPETSQTPEPGSDVDKLLSEADYRPTDKPADDDGKGANVEDILADAVYKPAIEPGHADSNLDWLDEEPTLGRESDNRRQPLIIDDDSLEATLDASFFAIDSEQQDSEVDKSAEPEQVVTGPGITDARDIEIHNPEFDETARTGSETDWPETGIGAETGDAESMQSVDGSLIETLAMTETQLDTALSADLPVPESLLDELSEAIPPQDTSVEPALGGPLEDPSLDGRLEFPTTNDQLAEPSLHGDLTEQPVETVSNDLLQGDDLNERLDQIQPDITPDVPAFEAPAPDVPAPDVPAPDVPAPDVLASDVPASDVSISPASWQEIPDSSSSDRFRERPSLHERQSSTPNDSSEPLSLDEPLETPSIGLPPVAPEIDENAESASVQDSLQPPSPEMSLETPNFEQPQAYTASDGPIENTPEQDSAPAPEMSLETPSFEQPQALPASDGLAENTPEQDNSQHPDFEVLSDTLSLDTAEPPQEIAEPSATASVTDHPIHHSGDDEALSAQNIALEDFRESDTSSGSVPSAQGMETNRQERESAYSLSEEIKDAVTDQSDQLSIQPPIDTSTVDDSQAAFAALAASPPVSVRKSGLDMASSSQATSASMAAEALQATSFPVDLTDGTEGKQFAIYHRRGKTQIVSTRGSWSALILTLPFLVYRHLFGTAVVYAIMAVILLGGLLVSSLAWYDAGESVTPLIQASAIGFGLLSFVGLIYLPFRYGNLWRGEKLEKRGFELLALVSADSTGQALTIARRNKQLDI